MFNQRQLEIIDLLQTEDRVSVSELTQRFGVSLVTVRQDLKKLEDQGVLKRTHGGAMIVEETDTNLSYVVRSSHNEKTPRVGLEPTTARLTAACSTD